MNLFVARRRSAYVGPARWFQQRVVALVLLVAIADFFFYEGPTAGLPIAAFLILLFVAAAAFNRLRSPVGWRLAAVLLLAAAVAALAADADRLSVSLAIGLSAVGIILFVRGAMGWIKVAKLAVLTPLVGWWRLVTDLLRIRRAIARRGRWHFGLSGWVVPVGLSLFFLAVFLVANPVIDRWAALLAPDRLLPLDAQRAIFWGMVALIVWPFLHLVKSQPSGRMLLSWPGARWLRSSLLDDIAIRRSLVSFNLLFAVQTLTDLGYLWGGMDLPDGMTHAEYAHRGAYPLMAAAMVAAAFMLVALRGDPDERRPLVLKPLLVVFAGQGAALVASSMLRLDLYVEAYSLTLWRVAAFVWMGLVAFGFLTILIRILAGHSTRWLVNVNACAAILTLWACCFVDFAGLVTGFNIGHSREATGMGPDLDLGYVISAFGARAIPALDARRDLLAGRAKQWTICVDGVWIGGTLDDWRDRTVAEVAATNQDWRTWSFADWRLKRYLSMAPQWTVPQPR